MNSFEGKVCVSFHLHIWLLSVSGNIVGAQFVGREKKEERKKEIWRELDGIFEAVLKV